MEKKLYETPTYKYQPPPRPSLEDYQNLQQGLIPEQVHARERSARRIGLHGLADFNMVVNNPQSTFHRYTSEGIEGLIGQFLEVPTAEGVSEHIAATVLNRPPFLKRNLRAGEEHDHRVKSLLNLNFAPGGRYQPKRNRRQQEFDEQTAAEEERGVRRAFFKKRNNYNPDPSWLEDYESNPDLATMYFDTPEAREDRMRQLPSGLRNMILENKPRLAMERKANKRFKEERNKGKYSKYTVVMGKDGQLRYRLRGG